MATATTTRPKADVRNRTRLSDKQTDVLRGLEAGKTPDEIAKQMKVSVNGVYGHMRRIEAHGVDLSKYRRSPNGSRKNRRTRKRSANSNGHSPGVKNFLKTLDQQEASLSQEDKALAKTIEEAKNTLTEAERREAEVHSAILGIKDARKRVAVRK